MFITFTIASIVTLAFITVFACLAAGSRADEAMGYDDAG
jgi:hypothetical protein